MKTRIDSLVYPVIPSQEENIPSQSALSSDFPHFHWEILNYEEERKGPKQKVETIKKTLQKRAHIHKFSEADKPKNVSKTEERET